MVEFVVSHCLEHKAGFTDGNIVGFSPDFHLIEIKTALVRLCPEGL